MKTSLVILASVLLVLGMVGVAFGLGETPVSATVTVSPWKDVTVTPCTPFTFGSLNPGGNEKPILPGCNPDGDIIVQSHINSNGDITVKLSGSDFIDVAKNIDIGNVYWDKDDTPVQALNTQMKETGVGEDTVDTLSAGEHVDLYFFINVPPAQEAGTGYTSTFKIITS